MADVDAQIRELIDYFKAPRRIRYDNDLWSTTQLGIEIVRNKPEAVAQIASTCIQESLDIDRTLGWMLSFLPEDQWPGMVALAVAKLLREPGNPAASTVIQCAGFQNPAATHPYLKQLFQINGDYGKAFTGNPIFREAAWENAVFLAREYATAEPEEQKRIARALLETRLLSALEFVRTQGGEYMSYLSQVGFEEAADGFRQLYPDRPLHLVFPPDYLTRLLGDYLPVSWMSIHPTWQALRPAAPRHRFGGASAMTCGVCGRAAHNLITLDPVPQGMGITGLSRLEIHTCLSCLGWERARLAYAHDASGRPRDLNIVQAYHKPEFQATPLLETTVALADLGPRWRWQPWEEHENLHRVGGHPIWVQTAEYPACVQCRSTSSFLPQLASPLVPGEDSEYSEWLWGMGGICYAF